MVRKMAVVDADSGEQIASPEIGDGPDAANFSAKRQLAFSSNGEGTLSVVDASKGYKVIRNLPTARGARTMTYDDLMDRAYLVTAKFGPLPEPTVQVPHPRPSALPDTFEVIVVGRKVRVKRGSCACYSSAPSFHATAYFRQEASAQLGASLVL
jgi:hypothetical protein